MTSTTSDFPSDWPLQRLGDIFSFTNGVNADKASYGRGCRFINVLETITYSHIHGPEIPGRVTLREAVVDVYAVEKGDILFNRTSETDADVGLASAFVGDERVVFGGFVIRGRPVQKAFDSTYAGYALRAPFIRSQVISMGQGAIRSNIGQESLRRIVVPVPPVGEQRAIAKVLNDVDALLTGLNRLIAKKRDLKQAAMQQLLTGKTRLPGYQDQWEVKTLRQIVETPITDGPHLTPTFLNDGVPFLSVNNLVDAQIDWRDVRFISQADHEEFSRKCRPKKGDILFGKAASVGKVALVESDIDFNIWSPIAMIRVDGRHDARFIYYQLQGADLSRQIALLTNSSSQGNIGMGDIEKLALSVPSRAEQVAITTILSEMDIELGTLEARRTKTKGLKQAMMQELLTGRIRLI